MPANTNASGISPLLDTLPADDSGQQERHGKPGVPYGCHVPAVDAECEHLHEAQDRAADGGGEKVIIGHWSSLANCLNRAARSRPEYSSAAGITVMGAIPVLITLRANGPAFVIIPASLIVIRILPLAGAIEVFDIPAFIGIVPPDVVTIPYGLRLTPKGNHGSSIRRTMDFWMVCFQILHAIHPAPRRHVHGE